jgi:hypothetical protein
MVLTTLLYTKLIYSLCKTAHRPIDAQAGNSVSGSAGVRFPNGRQLPATSRQLLGDVGLFLFRPAQSDIHGVPLNLATPAAP